MTRWLSFVPLLFACGGSAQQQRALTCAEVFGQDCGADYTVEFRFKVVPAGAPDGTPPTSCTVTKVVPEVQYFYAVRPTYRAANCSSITESDHGATIDCTNYCTTSHACISPVSGASQNVCVWQPPILPP